MSTRRRKLLEHIEISCNQRCVWRIGVSRGARDDWGPRVAQGTPAASAGTPGQGDHIGDEPKETVGNAGKAGNPR